MLNLPPYRYNAIVGQEKGFFFFPLGKPPMDYIIVDIIIKGVYGKCSTGPTPLDWAL
jgi:hypothetical protein